MSFFLSLLNLSQLLILILLAQGKVINDSDTFAILGELFYPFFTIERIGLNFVDVTSSFHVM